MPILVLGASIWAWLLGGSGVVAGGTGTWFAATWMGRKWTERKKAQLSAALLDAFQKGGKDGLEAYLFENDIVKGDRHAVILMKHLLPQVQSAAAKAELAASIAKAKDAKVEAEAEAESEAPARKEARRIEAPARIRAVGPEAKEG